MDVKPAHVLARRETVEDARRAGEEADLVDHRRDLLVQRELRGLPVFWHSMSTSSSACASIASAILSSAELPLGRRRVAPLREGARAVVEGGVDVHVARQGRRGVDLPRARVDDVRRAPVRGGDALAVDEVRQLDRHVLSSVWRWAAGGGTSSAGLRSKNPAGFNQKETVSTAMTGHSSGRVT